MPNHNGSISQLKIQAVNGAERGERTDKLAVEEPLEIRVANLSGYRSGYQSLAVTMRTPGQDFELAAGFLFGEGVIRHREEICDITYCVDPGEPQHFNQVNVLLEDSVVLDMDKFSRRVYTTSSCGICGTASLELVRKVCPELPRGNMRLPAALLYQLPSRLTPQQPVFSCTGGLHAAALFREDGTLLGLREDVGRHNALDKLIGKCLLENALPGSNTILLLSGRAGFELVQKAVMAGVPVIVSIGAPSSLAVELAREYGVTLAGFLRDQRFNIYAGGERIL